MHCTVTSHALQASSRRNSLYTCGVIDLTAYRVRVNLVNQRSQAHQIVGAQPEAAIGALVERITFVDIGPGVDVYFSLIVYGVSA